MTIEPTKVDGVDYSPEGVLALRNAIADFRSQALSQAAFDVAVVLTHAVAILSYALESQTFGEFDRKALYRDNSGEFSVNTFGGSKGDTPDSPSVA